MKFQLNVYGSPWLSNCAEDVVCFANTVLNEGHSISRVFFYFDGVYHGLITQSPASDEFDLLAAWQSLADKGIDLFLCIAAATNRGVLSEEEMNLNNKDVATVSSCFEITGLGQWASGFHDSDRIVSFK